LYAENHSLGERYKRRIMPTMKNPCDRIGKCGRPTAQTKKQGGPFR